MTNHFGKYEDFVINNFPENELKSLPFKDTVALTSDLVTPKSKGVVYLL
jgi:hypothetical protein